MPESNIRQRSVQLITNHYASRHGVPLQPECDERRRHQNDARYEDRGEVEGTITREHEVDLQTTVITWIRCCVGSLCIRISIVYMHHTEHAAHGTRQRIIGVML